MFKNNIKESIESKYIIDISDLKKGDIIFTTSFDLVSNTIRRMTSSDFSHVMLYVDFNSIIHADRDGVHSYNTQRILFDDKNHCKIFRLKEEIDEIKLNNIISYMRSLIGRPYSTFEAMLTKIYSGQWNSKKLFCSRLIAQAFSRQNINLVNNINYCTPENIIKSKYLKELIAPLRKLTEIEINIILTKKDKPKEQAKITNQLFSKIVKLTSNKDLYDFKTLIEYLKINSKHDEEISKILEDSGYLTMWIEELKDNSALYDIDLYNRCVSIEQKSLFNKSTFELLNRYSRNYNYYLSLCKEYNSSVFIKLHNLYNILCRQEILRLESLNKIKIKNKENDTLYILLLFLNRLFFLQSKFSDIIERKTFDFSLYELILAQLNLLINDKDIKIIFKKFNFENNFININYNLEGINVLFSNIINYEMRQKINLTNLYEDLQIKTNNLRDNIQSIKFINIININHDIIFDSNTYIIIN